MKRTPDEASNSRDDTDHSRTMRVLSAAARRFGWLLLTAIATLSGFLLWWRVSSPAPHLYNLARIGVDPRWREIAVHTLSRLRLPEGKAVVINPAAPTNNVELFIFDSKRAPTSEHRGLSGNCSYLGDSHTIACDVAYIRWLGRRYDLDKEERTRSREDGQIVARWVTKRTPEDLDRDYERLLTWVLAHELGHLLSGHKGRFFMSEHRARANFRVDNYCHKREFEADSYSIGLLASEQLEDYYYFIYELINRELIKMACPGQPAVALCDKVYAGTRLAITDDFIEYITDGTHPDFVIRLLRIGQIAQQSADFGILAYQLDKLIEWRLITPLAPTGRDGC